MSTATDPVCGMLVEIADGVLASIHQGQRYVFCSARCKQAFDSDPGRYVALERQRAPAAAATGASTAAAKELAKDPVCGMLVDKATSLHAERGGRTYYF